MAQTLAAPSSASMLAQSHSGKTSPSPMDRLVRLILPTPRNSLDSTSSDDESSSEAHGHGRKRRARSKTAPQQSCYAPMRSTVPDIGESPYNAQARKYSTTSSQWAESRTTRQSRMNSTADTVESSYSRSTGRDRFSPSPLSTAPALRNPWISTDASPNPNDRVGSYVESLGLESRAFPSPSTPPTSVWSTPMLQQTISKQSKHSSQSRTSDHSPELTNSPNPPTSIRPVFRQRRSSVSDVRSLHQDHAPLPAPPITSPPTAPASQSSFRRAFSKSKSKPNIGKFEWESSEDEYSDHEQLPVNAARFKEKAARLAREDEDNTSVRRVLREAAEFQAERERDGWASEGGGMRRRKKQKRRRKRREDPPVPPPSSRPGVRRTNSAGPGLESPPMNTSCDFFLPTRALRSFRKRSNSESSARPPVQNGWFGRRPTPVGRAPHASRDMGTQVDDDFLRFSTSPRPSAGPSNTHLQVPGLQRQRSSSFSDVPSLTPSGRQVGYGLAISSGTNMNATMYHSAAINSSVERLAVSSPPSKHHAIRTSAAGHYPIPTRRVPSPLPLPQTQQRYQPSPIPFPEEQYSSGYFMRGATPSALPPQLSILPIYNNNPLFHQDRSLPPLPPSAGRQSMNSSRGASGRKNAPSRVSGESEQDHVLNMDEGEHEYQNLFYSRPTATSTPTAVPVASTSAATSPQTLRFSFDSGNRSDPSTSQTTNEWAEDDLPRKPISNEPPRISPLRNEKSFSASLNEELTPAGRTRSHSAGTSSSKHLAPSSARQQNNHSLPAPSTERPISQAHRKEDSTGSIPPIKEVTVLRSPTLIRNSGAEHRWRASSIIPDLNDSDDEGGRPPALRRTRSSDESAGNSFIEFDMNEPASPEAPERYSYMSFDGDSPPVSPQNEYTFGIAPAATPSSFPTSIKNPSPEVTIREDPLRHSFVSTAASDSPSHSHHLSAISPSTVRGSGISMGSSTTSLGNFSRIFPHPPSPSESQYKRNRTSSLPPSNELERRSRLSDIGLRTSTSSPLGISNVR